jgi:hypothetical protein
MVIKIVQFIACLCALEETKNSFKNHSIISLLELAAKMNNKNSEVQQHVFSTIQILSG